MEVHFSSINHQGCWQCYRINYHNYLMYTLQDIHQKEHTLSNFCLATHVLYNERTLPIKFLEFAIWVSIFPFPYIKFGVVRTIKPRL